MSKKFIFFLALFLLLLLLFFSRFIFVNEETPILQNLIFNESDLVYDKPNYVSDYGPIMPFGAEIYDPNTKEFKLSPTYEFYLKENSTIVSPLNGFVAKVSFQRDSNDYFIWLKPSKTSRWIIEIDHVKNPKVREGTFIRAFQVIGNVGTWYPIEGVGRTELMIVKDGPTQYYYCPFMFLNKSLSPFYETLLNNIKTALSSYKTFDEKMPFCIYTVLKDGPNKDYEHLVVVS